VLDPLFDWAYKAGGMVVIADPVANASDIRLANTRDIKNNSST
jgi:hypothetical protein